MQGLVFLMDSCALSREREATSSEVRYMGCLSLNAFTMNIDEHWWLFYDFFTGFLRQRSPSIWVNHQAGGAEDYPVSHRHRQRNHHNDFHQKMKSHHNHRHRQRNHSHHDNFHQKFKSHHNHCHQACRAIHWPHGEGEKLKLKFEQLQVILMITFWKYL